jgi:hypothetical protein
MEFNLDFLKTAGEALSSFGKKDKDDDRFDSEVQDQTSEKDTTEIIKTKTEEKEQKEDTEEDLEKKLKNIEKVIDTFSGKPTQLPSSTDLVNSSSSNINVKPLDLGNIQAKANYQEYLKPSNRQDDRIALLYEDLKKYNLI